MKLADQIDTFALVPLSFAMAAACAQASACLGHVNVPQNWLGCYRAKVEVGLQEADAGLVDAGLKETT